MGNFNRELFEIDWTRQLPSETPYHPYSHQRTDLIIPYADKVSSLPAFTEYEYDPPQESARISPEEDQKSESEQPINLPKPQYDPYQYRPAAAYVDPYAGKRANPKPQYDAYEPMPTPTEVPSNEPTQAMDIEPQAIEEKPQPRP